MKHATGLTPTLLLVLVPCVAFFLLVHRPAVAEQAALEAEIARAIEMSQSLPLRLAQIEKLSKDVEQRRAFVQANRSRIPSAAVTAGFVHRVGMIAARHQLADVRMQPLPVEAGRTYRSHPYSVSFLASAPSTTTFLGELERAPNHVEVVELNIVPSRDHSPTRRHPLTVTATLRVVSADVDRWSIEPPRVADAYVPAR